MGDVMSVHSKVSHIVASTVEDSIGESSVVRMAECDRSYYQRTRQLDALTVESVKLHLDRLIDLGRCDQEACHDAAMRPGAEKRFTQIRDRLEKTINGLKNGQSLIAKEISTVRQGHVGLAARMMECARSIRAAAIEERAKASSIDNQTLKKLKSLRYLTSFGAFGEWLKKVRESMSFSPVQDVPDA